MKSQDIIILGLGRLGSSMAKQLEANGCKVMAVDSNPKKIRQIADYVTKAVCADVTDEDAMEELGVHNFDTAVIAIGHNAEATVLATIWVKEHGVKNVISKAFNDTQARILKKVGADQVIFPEREMGIRLANNLTMNNIIDAIELTDEYSIAKIPVLSEWTGKNLMELNLRHKYKINVIAVQKGNEIVMVPDAQEKITEDEVFVILGTNQMLQKLATMSRKEK